MIRTFSRTYRLRAARTTIKNNHNDRKNMSSACVSYKQCSLSRAQWIRALAHEKDAAGYNLSRWMCRLDSPSPAGPLIDGHVTLLAPLVDPV